MKAGQRARSPDTSPTTLRVPPQRAHGDGDDPRPRRQDRDAQGAELGQRFAARQQARSRRSARRDRRSRRAGTRYQQRHRVPTCTSRRTGKFLSPRSAQQLDRAFRVDADTGSLATRQHSTEKQPRGFRIESHGTLHGRLRREIGHDHSYSIGAIERQPGAGRQGPTGKGYELGGDRQLRLKTGTDPIFRKRFDWLILAVPPCCGPGSAAYPERPITMISPIRRARHRPGGRAIAPYLEKYLGGGAKTLS